MTNDDLDFALGVRWHLDHDLRCYDPERDLWCLTVDRRHVGIGTRKALAEHLRFRFPISPVPPGFMKESFLGHALRRDPRALP